MKMPRELEIRLEVFRIAPENLTKEQLKSEIKNCIDSCYKCLGETPKITAYYMSQIKKLKAYRDYKLPLDRVEEMSM